MAIYHVYLDESGAFGENRGKSLIGGFIFEENGLPENRCRALFSEWIRELRGRIAEAGTGLTPEHLREGDKLHDKKEQAAEPIYIFEHCCENKSSPFRWKTEAWGLERFGEKLRYIGARPVFFENPEGKYFIDNTTTFLTMMAVGLFRLYEELCKERPGQEVQLRVHAAERKDMTYCDEGEKEDSTPVAGQPESEERAGVIYRQRYINQLKNYAFLNGGESALESAGFRQSLGNLEIIRDIRDSEGKRKPHPATVLCDYICNARYSDNAIKNYLSPDVFKDAVTVDVFRQNGLGEYDFTLEKLKKERNWEMGLRKLISTSFTPEAAAQEFFAAMNEDTRFDRSACLNGVIAYIKPFIEDRETMEAWLERLRLIMKKTAVVRPEEAYREFKCNLLLYQYALYTHLGNAAGESGTMKSFKEEITHLEEVKTAEKLLLLYYNRRLVSAADSFQYKEGERLFETAAGYYQSARQNYDDLLLSFLELENIEDCPEQKQPEYGKIIGSYAQLLSHAVQASSGAEKEALRQKGEALLPEITAQFTAARDISRALQNRAELKCALGQRMGALEDLYLACCTGTAQNITPEEQCRAVLHALAWPQCSAGGAFILLHYVSLMHAALNAGEEPGETMLRVLTEGINLTRALEAIPAAETYPIASVYRHAAAALARSKNTGEKQRKEAAELLNRAVSLLRQDKSRVLTAIAVSTQAELAELMLAGKLPCQKGEPEKQIAELGKLYDAFTKMPGEVNPFQEYAQAITRSAGKPAPEALRALTEKIASRIAY